MFTNIAISFLQDVADKYLQKVLERNLDHISLASMKLSRFPTMSSLQAQAACLTDLNISKNNLFNGDEVFLVSHYCRNMHCKHTVI